MTPPARPVDTVIAVDWSGGADTGPRPRADAIWIARARAGAVETLYCRNRGVAETRLAEILQAERRAGRRVLAGFDFPFGYPAGFAAALTGRRDPFAVWDWLEARVQDTPRRNNRFDLAAEMNAALPGIGPFWGNALARDIAGLPRKGTERTGHGLPDRRAAERRLTRTQPCWKLATAGSVGSQTIMGLPVLARLRRRLGGAVWPFEPSETADLVLAEIWPGLIEPAVRAATGPGDIRDAVQVRLMARALAGLAPEALAALLADIPPDAAEEGWILGLGHAPMLEAALAREGAHATAPGADARTGAGTPGKRPAGQAGANPIDRAAASPAAPARARAGEPQAPPGQDRGARAEAGSTAGIADGRAEPAQAPPGGISARSGTAATPRPQPGSARPGPAHPAPQSPDAPAGQDGPACVPGGRSPDISADGARAGMPGADPDGSSPGAAADARAPAGRARDDCFALPAGVDWTPVEEALAQLEAALAPVTPVEEVALAAAAGRLLAAPATARRSNPPAANSAVDGYAFAFDAAGSEAELALAPGRSAAGAPFDAALPRGAALRILTGAEIPEGADTVVLEEDCTLAEGRISFPRPRKRGANIRPAGEDCRAGAALLAPGRRLTPADLARLAAGGVARVAVHAPLGVAVLSTGDELLDPGADPAGPGIFDANRPMLSALAEASGFGVIDLGAAPDREGAVRAALDRGAGLARAILTSGGASAGDEDHISRLLRAEGHVATWRIAMKPGRPLVLGTWRGVPVFGLPGNPVAAFVCYMVFARPALGRLAGERWRRPQGYLLPAAFTKSKKAGRREYLRARPTPEGGVEVFHSEGSGLVGGLSWAEGLVELPEPAAEIRPGTPVRYMPFAGLLP